jgi:hypothetical protein
MKTAIHPLLAEETRRHPRLGGTKDLDGRHKAGCARVGTFFDGVNDQTAARGIKPTIWPASLIPMAKKLTGPGREAGHVDRPCGQMLKWLGATSKRGRRRSKMAVF